VQKLKLVILKHLAPMWMLANVVVFMCRSQQGPLCLAWGNRKLDISDVQHEMPSSSGDLSHWKQVLAGLACSAIVSSVGPRSYGL
jgi:hypothetical protein